MAAIQATSFVPASGVGDVVFGEAELAAAALLARYGGRTLEAYRSRPAHVRVSA